MSDPWRWQSHPAVWLLVAGVVALWVWAMRRIGPTATRPGETIVTRGQVGWFAAAVVVLAVAAGWPMHDVGEQYLYSVHMLQHLLLTLVLPPMIYFATPTWLARLVVGDGRAYRVIRRLSRPVTATVAFSAVVVFSHWPAVVNASTSNGPAHFGVHVLVVASAAVMWVPVCGPFPELRIPLPAQMAYLFVQSIIPTVPSAWLILAEGAVYESYDTTYRLWGMSVTTDQQVAGLLMKLAGGFYLWTIITVLFFRFAAAGTDDDRHTGAPLDRRAPEPLTWQQVERELERAGPAPPERGR